MPFPLRQDVEDRLYRIPWSILHCSGGRVHIPRLVLLCILVFGLVAGAVWFAHPDHTVVAKSPPSLTSLVDPFIGTAGGANVFPGASMPHGMIQWSPESTAGGLMKPGGYNDGDLIIRGFGVTHLSGAGCVAFANVPIMPTVRPVRVAPQPNGSPYSDRFIPSSQSASPGSYRVRLKSGIGIHLAVTDRTGLARIDFPRSRTATVLIDAGNGAAGSSNIDGGDSSSVAVQGRDLVTGKVQGGHFCGLGNRYTLYFAAKFSRPFTGAGTWTGRHLVPGRRTVAGTHTGAYLRFDTRHDRTVRLKIGLSYVDTRGALQNLAHENPNWDVAAVAQAADQSWNGLLGRVQVGGGTLPLRRTFYTALYHSLLAPTIFSDADGRYRGFDERVHRVIRRVLYANFSGWDIYRSEMQLLSWLEPQRAGDMAQSLLADAREGGLLPKWPVANGYTGEMNGDSADPIIADVLAFAGPRFDVQRALVTMVHGATAPDAVEHGYQERPGLASYLRQGWLAPQTGGWGSASTTLEFATDDFAIAQVAGALGKKAIADHYYDRSHGWRRLFDSGTGMVRPRSPGGAFLPSFSPTSTTEFVEGTAAQYVWMVPHDLTALFGLMGGRTVAVKHLDNFFHYLNGGPTSQYYWAGNETDIEAPWEYDAAGAPWRTQAVVRRIETDRYSDSPAGLPGNDDLGALSSWYVWAAIGLYPEVPGVAGFSVGSPLFSRIDLQVAGGRTMHITAPDAAVGRPYVQGMWLNGRPYHSSWLPLATLGRHTVVRFALSARPNTSWSR